MNTDTNDMPLVECGQGREPEQIICNAIELIACVILATVIVGCVIVAAALK